MNYFTFSLLTLFLSTWLPSRSSGMYGAEERLADVCAVQGRLFTYQLSPRHFNTSAGHAIEVNSLGSLSAPSWLEVSEWQLRGVPLDRDTGTQTLRIRQQESGRSRILSVDVRPKSCPGHPRPPCPPFAPRTEALFLFPELPPPRELAPADRVALLNRATSHLPLASSQSRLSSLAREMEGGELLILSQDPPDADLPPHAPLVSLTLSCGAEARLSVAAPRGVLALTALFAPALPWVRRRRQLSPRAPYPPLEVELVATETVDILPTSSVARDTSSLGIMSSVARDTSSLGIMSSVARGTSSLGIMSSVARDTSSLGIMSSVARDTSSVPPLPHLTSMMTSFSSMLASFSSDQPTPPTRSLQLMTSSPALPTTMPTLAMTSSVVPTQRDASSMVSTVSSSILPETSMTSVVSITSSAAPFSSSMVLLNSSVVPRSSSLVPISTSMVSASSSGIPIFSSIVPSSFFPNFSSPIVLLNSSIIPVSSSGVPRSPSMIPNSTSIVPVSSFTVPMSSPKVVSTSLLVPVSSVIGTRSTQLSTLRVSSTSSSTLSPNLTLMTSRIPTASAVTSSLIPTLALSSPPIPSSQLTSSIMRPTPSILVPTSAVTPFSVNLPMTSSLPISMIASSLPITSIASSLPISSMTSSLPISSMTSSLSISSMTSSLPISSMTSSLSISSMTSSLLSSTVTSSLLSSSMTSSLLSSSMTSSLLSSSMTSSLLSSSMTSSLPSSSLTSSLLSSSMTSSLLSSTVTSVPLSSTATPQLPFSSSIISSVPGGPSVTPSFIVPTSTPTTVTSPPTSLQSPRLVSPLPLLTPSPGVLLRHQISNDTFYSQQPGPLTLELSALVGEIPDWLLLSNSAGYQLAMIAPFESVGETFYVALVATDSEGQQVADVISIIPEAFTAPLHSISITLLASLSEVLAGGLAVQVDLWERLERGTGDDVRVLGLSEGSTRVRFSVLTVETSRDCQTVNLTFLRVLHNRSYTQEFISAFLPVYLLEEPIGELGPCYTEAPTNTLFPFPSIGPTSSGLQVLLSSLLPAIFLVMASISTCSICCCAYRYRRHSLSPAESRAFYGRRPVVMETDRLLAQKSRRATVLPGDLNIPGEAEPLLGDLRDVGAPPALPRPPQPRFPPSFNSLSSQ